MSIKTDFLHVPTTSYLAYHAPLVTPTTAGHLTYWASLDTTIFNG